MKDIFKRIDTIFEGKTIDLTKIDSSPKAFDNAVSQWEKGQTQARKKKEIEQIRKWGKIKEPIDELRLIRFEIKFLHFVKVIDAEDARDKLKRFPSESELLSISDGQGEYMITTFVMAENADDAKSKIPDAIKKSGFGDVDAFEVYDMEGNLLFTEKDMMVSSVVDEDDIDPIDIQDLNTNPDTGEQFPNQPKMVKLGKRITAIKNIVANHQAETIDGQLVDATTANLLNQVWEKTTKPELKEKFETISLGGLVKFAWSLTK